MYDSFIPNPSPIHGFTPRDDATFQLGDEVRVGDIVLKAHQILLSHLRPLRPDESPKDPSTLPQGKRYTPTRFESPRFYLTKEVLETNVTVTRHVFTMLRLFKFMDGILVYDEQWITRNAVHPIVDILLATFEARVPSQARHIKTGWIADDCMKLERSGVTVELDIMIKRKGTVLPEGVDLMLTGLQSVIEVKTPCSCNGREITSFARGSPGTDTTTTRRIQDELGKQGSLLQMVHPEQDVVIHALSVAPAHLFLAASNGKRLAIGSDIIGIPDAYPVVVTKPEYWLEYIDKLGAFVFAIMHRNDSRISEAWSEDCPDQVRQVQSLIVTAGKALQPTPAEAALAAFWAAIWAVQQAFSLPLLLLLTHLRCLNLTQRLKQYNVGKMVLNPKNSSPWRLPLGLALGAPHSTHETVENMIYVYKYPPVVIKLFSNAKTYANELACYERLAGLQGNGISVVLAKGVCSDDQRPFLILSNDGERLDDVSDEDKTELQPVVDAIHSEGLHHHDLHPRNVVRNSRGKLSIIDFGYARPCNEPECPDDWKGSWAS